MNKYKDNKSLIPEQYMRLAIRQALAGVAKGQTPFGALIVFEGKVVACTHNQVWKRTDITAHAEILALRQACRKLQRLHLAGAALYSTCEPCPMCFSAIHWARITKIFFGASIEHAAAFGFNELKISNQQMAKLGDMKLELHPGILQDECKAIFQTWKSIQQNKAY